MKKNIMLAVVLALVVGVMVGFALKGIVVSPQQSAAVVLSTSSNLSTIDKAFESTSATFSKINGFAFYRVDPSKIVASVDLTNITEDTKPFVMNLPDVTSGGVTIEPATEEINCGQVAGGNTVHCCNTGSNSMTITNPTTGFTMTMPNGCINGEWDFAQ